MTVFATIGAFVAGLFIAVLLMMFGIKPLDTVTTVVIPVALGIIALVAAITRPARCSASTETGLSLTDAGPPTGGDSCTMG